MKCTYFPPKKSIEQLFNLWIDNCFSSRSESFVLNMFLFEARELSNDTWNIFLFNFQCKILVIPFKTFAWNLNIKFTYLCHTWHYTTHFCIRLDSFHSFYDTVQLFLQFPQNWRHSKPYVLPLHSIMHYEKISFSVLSWRW